MRCSWTSRPSASASRWTSGGTPLSTNHPKMSPTPLWPASYPHCPGTMPPSTTPHMPGMSRTSAPFITWQVEVPMIATICPAPTAPAAGAVTWASTLPTQTAMPSGRPMASAIAGGEAPGPGPERADRVLELVDDEALEGRVQRGEEVGRRVGAVLERPLEPGRAGVADVGAAQLPHDPVGGLDPVVHPLVELGVLLEQLQALGQLPLRRELAAVAGDPRLAALVGQRVQPVGVALGGVVLPELHVGVGPVGVLGQLAQRGAVGQHRQHRAGREVGADPDHRRPGRRRASATASRTAATIDST